MSIGSYIKKQKLKFRGYKHTRSQVENVKRAEELQRLKEQRIKLEGKAQLEKYRLDEIRRIEVAKATNPSKIRKFGMGLQKAVQEHKARSVDGPFNKGSVGLDFSGTSPFGNEPKKADKLPRIKKKKVVYYE